MQSRNKMSCLFMLNIFDLVLEFLELFLFGFRQFLASMGAFLASIYARL